MTVVVTGASGHVGSNLVRELVARGRPVRALVHEDERGLEGVECERVKGDVTDPGSLERALDGAETVFHLAVKISIVGDPDGLVHRTNVEGPRNVAEACLKAGVKRLVHFSSIHALQNKPLDSAMDETRPLADGDHFLCYDRSKARGEKQLAAVVERGLDAVTVNPAAVLGPHDYKPSRMGEVLLDLYHGTLPALIQGGFDWVDVRDVVAGALVAEEKGRTGERYLLGGEYRTVPALAALVQEITGARVPTFAAPVWLCKLGVPFAGLWSRLRGTTPLFTTESLEALQCNPNVSHAKAARELGYEPRPLRQTIEDTFAWYRETGRLGAMKT